MSNSIVTNYGTAGQPRLGALTAGIGLALMTVIAAVANFAVIQVNLLPGDVQGTVANLASNAGSVRSGAVALLIAAALDVLVAWGLYEVLRPVNNGLSLLGGWLRLVYAAVFAISINSLFGAVRAAPSDPAGAILLADAFNDGWMVGQVFFGLHLGVVGALAWRAPYIHRVFGLLLVIAGIGYLFDGIAALLNPDFGFELALFTFVGEVVFIFWLLIRGSRLKIA